MCTIRVIILVPLAGHPHEDLVRVGHEGDRVVAYAAARRAALLMGAAHRDFGGFLAHSAAPASTFSGRTVAILA